MSASPLLLAFYGDDFTGSTDALESLARAGVRSVLFTSPPTPAQFGRHPGLQAAGVAGRTRSMKPGAMEAELRPAFAALGRLGAPHVHYKVCSTFDSSPEIGSIGRAIEVGAEAFPAPFVPLLVGAPFLGRHCLFGNLFARAGGPGRPVFRLDRHPVMARHPVTPADESDLRLHLARQTAKRIGLVDALAVEGPEAGARAALEAALAAGAEIVLFDAVYDRHLARIGALIDPFGSPARPLFTAGSSGVEAALASAWAARGLVEPPKAWPAPGPARPLLVASGSCSAVTAAQIDWALGHGFGEVALDTAAVASGRGAAEIDRAAAAASALLAAGRSAIVHTSHGADDPRLQPTAEALARGPNRAEPISEATGGALGEVVRGALLRAPVRRVLIAGGDSSSSAARALGLESLEMIAPLAPGAPLGRARAPGSPADGLEFCLKGGQVGPEDFFGRTAEGSAL